VIQAKDKFYSDMMVSKDAKIMNLIEGSDLTTLLQKHEMDIENIRKEYSLEMERIKTQQESEQKHVLSLLQRQNGTLEAKSEKLSSHIKTLESKLRDLLSALESKNKIITEKEDEKIQLETLHAFQLDQERLKLTQVIQEKEYLRHKVIRLNMESKGTGENNVDNMVKRIARETTEVTKNYTELSTQYETTLDENTKLSRQIKDREKWIECLEKEVSKRTEEFKLMVSTFEQYLESKNRQARKDRTKRLLKLTKSTSEDAPAIDLSVQPATIQTLRIQVPDSVVGVLAFY
jgi:chromosome segregation ATPase